MIRALYNIKIGKDEGCDIIIKGTEEEVDNIFGFN